MPCYDSRNDRDYIVRDVSREYKRDIDKLTRMLCSLCKRLTQNGDTNYLMMNQELRQWWEEHQIQDRRRLAREAEEKRRVREADIKKLKTLKKRYPDV